MSDAPKRLELDYPEIDFDFMPKLLGDVIKSLSNQYQIDPVIPFTSGLGVMLTATGGRVKSVISDSWIQHPSLYLCPIADTADGKSQIINKLRQPLIDYENRMRNDGKAHHAKQTALHEIAEAKLKAIKDSMSATKSKSKMTPATDADLSAALDDVANSEPDPIPLILMGGDATPDSLTQLLQLHGSLGIIDAEGTLFNHLSGKKHNTGDAYETILAATSGDQIKTHRIGRGDMVVNNPHLVICVAVQPDVWLNLTKDMSASNRGVVGRFVPLVAKSHRGFRDVYAIEKPIDQTLMDRWEKVILQILNNKSDRQLRLTDEGYKLFQQTRAKLEPKLIDPDTFLNGFGARLMGNLITVAMLFTLIDDPDQDQFINDQALEMALALTDPLLAHRRLSDGLEIERSPELRILDKIAQMMDECDASKTGDLGMLNKQFRFSIRDDLQQTMKGQKWLKDGGMDAMKSALANLEIKCWIQFDGDHHIIARSDLRQHHRNRFRATSVPHQSENATEMPLSAVLNGS